MKNPKIKIAKARALVTKHGRIQVDTVNSDRKRTEGHMMYHDEISGVKVRRVSVVCVLK
jgi:hypothetical protein